MAAMRADRNHRPTKTKMNTTENTKQLGEAGNAPAFPCNPTPFALGLAELVREQGTDSIKTDESKRILFVLIAQSYGQLSTVDLMDEHRKLWPS